jgi:hypothetical protein
LRDYRHKESQAENEQHRIGVDKVIPTAKRQQVTLRPVPPAALSDFGVPLRGFQPIKGGEDDQ